MNSSDQLPKRHELPPQARRAVRLIYVAMAVMIFLPLLLVWLTGAMDF